MNYEHGNNKGYIEKRYRKVIIEKLPLMRFNLNLYIIQM